MAGRYYSLQMQQCSSGGDCKHRQMQVREMQLLQSLFFFVAKHNLVLFAQHIPGVDNGAADALSRNNQRSFFMQVTGAQKDPTPIPVDLLEALVLRPQDWTSQSWARSLLASWEKALLIRCTGHMGVPSADL